MKYPVLLPNIFDHPFTYKSELKLKIGDYVKVNFGKLNKNGIANIGYRPTFKGQRLLLETNIFGINKNLYNKVIHVSFKKFIR